VIPREIEAKLSVRRARDAHAIAKLQKLGRYRFRRLPAQRLHSVYLDTPSFSLARHGTALRVRRHKRSWEATAKFSGRAGGGIHQHNELTVPLPAAPSFPFPLPDGTMANQLTALVAGAPLKPILVSGIVRQRLEVSAGTGRRLIAEIDVDRVTLRNPRTRQTRPPYWEVEVELRHGRRRDIVELAQLLRRRYRLRPSRESKLTGGLRSFHPGVTFSSEAQFVTPADTITTAARKIVARHLARIRRHDPATRMGNDPDALHDMRVATRRLRAVVRAFKRGFPKPLRQHLRQELKWLGQMLGAVRDVDVQLTHLEKHARHHSALQPLRQHLLAQRRRRRPLLSAALGAQRYVELLAALDGFAVGSIQYDATQSGARHPVGRCGRRALRKSLRRLHKDGRRAMAQPTAERLHTLRISAKRVRYVLEFLKDLTGRRGQRLIKTLTELQDILGRQHDAVVAMTTAQEVLRHLDSSGNKAAIPALQRFAAAQLRAANAQQRAARAAWKQFDRPRVAHHVQAMCDQLDRMA
jgi:inorganic triphosphatase YgiF